MRQNPGYTAGDGRTVGRPSQGNMEWAGRYPGNVFKSLAPMLRLSVSLPATFLPDPPLFLSAGLPDFACHRFPTPPLHTPNPTPFPDPFNIASRTLYLRLWNSREDGFQRLSASCNPYPDLATLAHLILDPGV